MNERIQTKPFERWVGQTVYREVQPSRGPYAHRIIGIRRGVIVAIYPYELRTTLLHETHFDVDIEWHTRKVTALPIPEGFSMLDPQGRYHPRVCRPFDYGLITPTEMQWLLDGALLGSDGPTWDEPQPRGLAEVFPLYRKVLADPTATHFLMEE